MTKTQKKQPPLQIRRAHTKDIENIHQLVDKVYPNMNPYPLHVIRGQINNYPEGHFVAVFDGQIIGYCAAIRIDEKVALSHHTWREITGNGYGSTHDDHGDYLYGYEVCVDPEYRGLKIGERFYSERKKLCTYLRLKGIAFGGRLPNLAKNIKRVGSPEKYIELVQSRKLRDPVLYFQLRNGFEVLGILKDYLPTDKDSLGYACHLVWKNPGYQSANKNHNKGSGIPDKVRVAAIQYKQRQIKSFDEFIQIVEYFVDVVSDYHCDFALFPELFTFQLISIERDKLTPMQAVDKLTNYTAKIRDVFSSMAIKYNVNIIAGSHPIKQITGDIHNVSLVFLRDGSTHEQPKIHPTPNEKFWWNFQGGNTVNAINTDCGPIGVLICYDSEFPELGRHLVDQGANILFVPFLTDERQSYNRVRFCCQARAIENQMYSVLAGNVGNLPRVENMDIHYAQSCILTPCDFPFARDGVAADTTPNVETVAIADLRLQDLTEARSSGTVQNLKDRRHDLYSLVWHKI